MSDPVIHADTNPPAHKWYREPESFIALAALIVSLTAVVVGVYEAALQRRHDRAEVWPNLEVQTFRTVNGATIQLDNTGIGPAIVKFIDVSVDGKPQRNWPAVLRALGDTGARYENSTVANHAIRPGEKATLISLPNQEIPTPFGPWISRVSLRICYASVFDDRWQLIARAWVNGRVESTSTCPEEPDSTEF
ncbi:MAG: hypothetical protein ACREND_10280 [Gemmatimonadaceae bacterium]